MENRRNFYRILHVQPDAPVEIIRTSYRTLMQRLKMHPDLGGDHWNAALINEAYAVLTDPVKRAAYDQEFRQHLEDIRSDPTAAEEARNSDEAPAAADYCAFCQTLHDLPEPLEPDAVCMNCASPLYPADRPESQGPWLRAIERIPREQPVAFCTHWPQAESYLGHTLDLSLTGMKFVCNLPVTPGRFLKIDSEVVSAVARVVYCRPQCGTAGPWEVGVEFFRLRFAVSRGAFVSTRA